jgi:dimeric dUTPase (all-alpha-NTP-PPase superfamily)
MTNKEIRVRMITDMLSMQDEINSQIGGDWRERRNPWYRAVWTECAEMLDHIGWKWWKHQEADMDQVKLEVVDIFHFGLSDILQEFPAPIREVAEVLEVAFSTNEHGYADESARDCIEALASKSLIKRGFPLPEFAALMDTVGMSLEDLYRLYVGKNVLNRFRQDQGYKTGSYRKSWDGREDNEHLVEIVRGLDAGVTGFRDRVYAALSVRYAGVLEGAA